MNLHRSAADPRGRLDFVARCIRGIEWNVAAEIDTRVVPGAAELGHREVRVSTCGLPSLAALQLARVVQADESTLYRRIHLGGRNRRS